MSTFSLPTALVFGVHSRTGTFIESIDNDATVEVAELLTSAGEIGRAHPYKSMSKGTVKGHDTITVVPGTGTAGVGESGGVTIITSLKTSEKNTEHNGWEYSYSYYPEATSGG